MEEFGKLMLVGGAVLTIVGGIVLLLSKVSGLGQLPGDIVIQRDNFSCSFPLMTSIILSIVLTIVLNIILRIINR
jgi:hypothetical protein